MARMLGAFSTDERRLLADCWTRSSSRSTDLAADLSRSLEASRARTAGRVAAMADQAHFAEQALEYMPALYSPRCA